MHFDLQWSALKCIPEQRRAVAQLLQLLVGILPPNLVFGHAICLLVCAPVHKLEGEGSNETACSKAQRGAEAGRVLWLLSVEEDELLRYS
jgi:hypothetical protein